MCGICGIINRDPFNPVDGRVLKNMCNKIFHRGPDDEGIYLNRNVGMAVRRLSIIDIDGGNQPITNEDGSVVVVYNGEIYNHLDLRNKLIKKGHKFKSRCDTEILVHLYEEYGNNLVEHLNGMFAFCLYDKNSDKVFMARDRLGIKPLYWINTKDWILFASEVKAFLEFPEFNPALDYEALHHYLTFRFVPAPMTLFKDVKKLLPGHFIEYFSSKRYLGQTKYWDLNFEHSIGIISPDKSEKIVHNLVKDSVDTRLMSEVPLGAMLSGGIDSTIVVSCMKNGSRQRVSTFTINYEEEGSHNEREFANIAANHLQTDHHDITISFEDFMNRLKQMVYFMDEPIADPAAIPIYDLSSYAKKYVTVLLSGIGGDELFAGYNVYKEAVYSKYLNYIPNFIWSNITLPISNLVPNACFGKNFIQRVREPIENIFLGSSFIYGGFSESSKANLYTDSFREYQKNFDSHDIVRSILGADSPKRNLDKMIYLDTKLWLADSHLIMIDKMSMANSIEVRAPFLDHRLVELAAGIPKNLKINLFNSKMVLKKAFRTSIPKVLINRKKQGFSTPLQKWFSKNEDDLEYLLCNTKNLINQYIRNKSIKRLIKINQSGKGDFSANIFTLIILEMWLNEFVR
jgi:asparagine synthase (glutamine-hydrolysing)